jgi:small GTP-binding protein
MESSLHFSVVTLGDSAVGKTTIIAKLSQLTSRNPHGTLPIQQPTVAAMFRTHRAKIADQEVVLEIWDTAGSERYRAITKNYHRTAHVVLLIYAINDPESFKNIENWLDDVKENSIRPIIYLIGNKNDLIDQQFVNPSIAQKYADDNKLTFIQLSAFTGDGLIELFDEIAARLVSQESPLKPNNGRYKEQQQIVTLTDPAAKTSNWCCY